MNRFQTGLLFYFNILSVYAMPQAHLEVSTSKQLQPCSKSMASCTLNVAQASCPTANPTITITNNSNTPARNIQVSSTDPNYSKVSISSNSCATNLPAHSSCSISFYTPQSASFTINQVNVTAGNAPAASFAIAAYPCFAYAISAEPQTAGVYQCSVSAGGLTSANSCILNNAISPGAGLTIVTLGTNQYAFMTDPTNSSVNRCTVNPITHNMSNCTALSVFPPFENPIGISTATIQGQPYIFISDPSRGIYTCLVSANGSVSCGAPVLSDDGSSPPYFMSPAATAFSSNTNPSFIYIVQSGSVAPGIYRCNLNTDGSIAINTCTPTPFVDPSFYQGSNFYPMSISFATVSSGTYAYIGSSGDNGGAVSVCPLVNNFFSSGTCFQTTSPVSPPWIPFLITIQAFQGSTYAYVPNFTGTNIYRCLINPANGSFSGCAALANPSSGWGSPASFVFL